MTQVTLTELKANTGKYVDLAATGDILITRNGKIVARLTSAKQNKVEAVKSLFGILSGEKVDLEKEREERIKG